MGFKGLSEVFSAVLIAVIVLTFSTLAYTLYSKSLEMKCLGLEEEMDLLKFKSKVGILVVSTQSKVQAYEVLIYNYGVDVELERVVSDSGSVAFKVEVYNGIGWTESRTILNGKLARITIYSSDIIQYVILCFKGGIHVKVKVE